ncbi:SEL1-like repeat protein [Kangiella sediminilitoris]|uniref:Sel1 domain protein repeat-containing protein n=1 Tax=Kangiella sediminilitoris TaxID=1144748 RepID=A0A1B3B8X5_9GAMM|nr:tetratricopeptide repeat protein [Kangiella sediminilitoris]AOE49230.1 Sel1 domain protein repeat-containing protein [Kangiella sediminilitoris]
MIFNINWTTIIKVGCLASLCLMLLIGCNSGQDHASLCKNHFQAKSYQVALKHCQQAVDNGDVEAHYYLGMIYIRVEGKDEQGRKLIYKAAEEGFTKAVFHKTVETLLESDSPEKSAAALKKMQVFAESGDDVAQFWMGNVFLFGYAGQNKSPNEASYWYQMSVQQGNVRAMNNLAWIKALARDSALFDPEGAIELATRVVKKYPDSHGYIDTLAAAYAANGQYDKALDTQTRALELVREGKCQNCSQKLLDYYQKHLQRYQQKKPLQEELL